MIHKLASVVALVYALTAYSLTGLEQAEGHVGHQADAGQRAAARAARSDWNRVCIRLGGALLAARGTWSPC